MEDYIRRYAVILGAPLINKTDIFLVPPGQSANCIMRYHKYEAEGDPAHLRQTCCNVSIAKNDAFLPHQYYIYEKQPVFGFKTPCYIREGVKKVGSIILIEQIGTSPVGEDLGVFETVLAIYDHELDSDEQAEEIRMFTDLQKRYYTGKYEYFIYYRTLPIYGR